jgi:hypothetical protein
MAASTLATATNKPLLVLVAKFGAKAASWTAKSLPTPLALMPLTTSAAA